MEFALRFATVCAIVTVSSGQLNYNNPVYIPEYIQTQSSVVEALQQPPTDQTHDSANINYQQLPKIEIAKAFYTPELQPSSILKAPAQDAIVTNFNPQSYPGLPSQDLQLPSLAKWNPNDDPNLYYPVVVDKIIPLNLPTAQFPKKFNKNLQKVKPSGFKSKDVVLIDDIIGGQNIDKTLYTLAKQENKKLLQLEKFRDDSQAQVKDAVPAESIFGGLSSSNSLSHGDFGTSGFSQSLSGSGDQGGHSGDRMEFHVHGHDGPNSYKWGFDTGKGHNRQVRFEERDKHGYVKGHYGYYDKHGKIRMVHYDAHPHEGFHASDGDIGPN